MKIFHRLTAMVILVFIFRVSPAQTVQRNHEFDFWIGDWDLTWNDTSKGTNTITHEMSDYVVYEHFKDPLNAYFGWSWSVYDTLAGKWKQTWVDNQGAYLDFTGKMRDGKMILERSFTNPKGKLIMQRMIFYNITSNKFDWNWENSGDGGATWKLAWMIHYNRKKT